MVLEEEGDGEPMATVGAKGVEEGEGEAITTVGRPGRRGRLSVGGGSRNWGRPIMTRRRMQRDGWL